MSKNKISNYLMLIAIIPFIPVMLIGVYFMSLLSPDDVIESLIDNRKFLNLKKKKKFDSF